MSKNRQPASFIKLENRNKTLKRSKEYLKRREEAEVKLGDKNFVTPESLNGDDIALEKWEYLKSLYMSLDSLLVTDADKDAMEQYCILYSEWRALVLMKKNILKDCKTKRLSSLDTMKELSNSKIETAINNKNTLLQRLGSKLLLDPVSRVKAVPVEDPKKKKIEEDPLSQFGLVQ